MSLEPSREFANSSETLSERIRMLAAQGLKVRDISSLLHVHPQIVIRVIEAQSGRGGVKFSDTQRQGTDHGQPDFHHVMTGSEFWENA